MLLLSGILLVLACSCTVEVPDQIAVGTYHLCYRTDGQVTCRMLDNIADEGHTDVPAGVEFVDIVSGWKWSCGLDTDGIANCWGDEVTTSIVAKTPDDRFVKLGATSLRLAESERMAPPFVGGRTLRARQNHMRVYTSTLMDPPACSAE